MSVVALAVSLMLAAPDAGVVARPLPPEFIAARKAFERLKALEGSWVATEGGKETAASFEIVAGGTAVLQRAGFVAIYYVDGDSVMATLFPDDGNQPRFRAHAVVEPKGKPAVL